MDYFFTSTKQFWRQDYSRGNRGRDTTDHWQPAVPSWYMGKLADRQNHGTLDLQLRWMHFTGNSSHPLHSARVIWICKKKKIDKKISGIFNWSVSCLILRSQINMFRDQNPFQQSCFCWVKNCHQKVVLKGHIWWPMKKCELLNILMVSSCCS